MQSEDARTARSRRLERWGWVGLFLYIIVVGGYFLLRYQGRWAETDSTIFAKLIRVFSENGRIIPSDNLEDVYPNGFAFQAISAYILALTGVNVATLQQRIYPLLASLVVIPAWMFYRELLGSGRKAMLTTLLLFTQPEFLFVILRSSHEKFTRTLLLLCLFLLTRSFRLRHRPAPFAVQVGLFYLATFAFISSNNLLAHSFIFAVVLALGLGWLLRKRADIERQHSYMIQRLSYASMICLGLAYLFTFYVYSPAQHDLIVLRNIWERMVALFLDVQQQSTNAYSQVAVGWINLPVYFMVSVANWLVLIGSFILWAGQSWRWVIRRSERPDQMSWLLWLFYTAFALQGVISAVADASGSIGNLQHRLFPSFSIMAVALLGSHLGAWRPRRFRRTLQVATSLLLGMLAALSVMKATNEPLLSNKWTFYRENELMSMSWADANLHNGEIWTEFDERLGTAYFTSGRSVDNRNQFFADDLRVSTRNIVVTDVTRLRSARLGRPLPVPVDAIRVYDNGGAQIYHLRPDSPYQK